MNWISFRPNELMVAAADLFKGQGFFQQELLL
jgi:hypothetical protein